MLNYLRVKSTLNKFQFQFLRSKTFDLLRLWRSKATLCLSKHFLCKRWQVFDMIFIFGENKPHKKCTYFDQKIVHHCGATRLYSSRRKIANHFPSVQASVRITFRELCHVSGRYKFLLSFSTTSFLIDTYEAPATPCAQGEFPIKTSFENTCTVFLRSIRALCSYVLWLWIHRKPNEHFLYDCKCSYSSACFVFPPSHCRRIFKITQLHFWLHTRCTSGGCP